jgi:hypothetical protein
MHDAKNPLKATSNDIAGSWGHRGEHCVFLWKSALGEVDDSTCFSIFVYLSKQFHFLGE